MKTDLTVVWIILLGLTVLGPSIGSGERGLTGTAALMLLIASLKFLGITKYYMELRHAHIAWRIGTTFFIVLVSSILVIGYATAGIR